MIDEIVLKCLKEITGLEIDDLRKIKDSNIYEIGLLDSLSLVNLIYEIETETGKKIDISKCSPNDFETIGKIIETVENKAQ